MKAIRLLTPRLLPALLMTSVLFALPHCGGSTGDGAAGADGGCGPMPGFADCYNPCTQQMHGLVCIGGKWTCDDPLPSECGECGPMPGAMDCVNPCTQQMHGPVCEKGSWVCNDPSPSECGDADAGCSTLGSLVPVSCTPFPATTKCDPFGVWSLGYDVPYPGKCTSDNIAEVVIQRGSDGIARVGFGSTESATLSEDGCQLSVISKHDWTNPSEYGTLSYTLTLDFSVNPDAGADGGNVSGTLDYQETGFCSGSGTTSVTATKKSE